MNTLAAVAGIATVAAITPGPNNFIVLGAAARGGFIAALAPILGVIAIPRHAGPHVERRRRRLPKRSMGLATDDGPGRRLSLLARAPDGLARGPGAAPAGGPGDRTSWASVFAFQFANPKAWVMVLTITSAVSSGDGPHHVFVELSVLLAAILGACLAVWAAAGAALSRIIERRAIRVWFDRAMGFALAGSAVMLIVP